LKNIKRSIPLSKYTTLMVGGNADYFCIAKSLTELKNALAWAKEHSQPILVIGGGSNLLVADKGFKGLIIKYGAKGIKFEGQDDGIYVTASAGESLDVFVSKVCAQNYFGVECLSGIPGTVGGAVVQNAGAYGQEIKDPLTSLKVLNIETLELVDYSNDGCNFQYRNSRFKRNSEEIVVEAKFKLSFAQTINYGQDIMKIISGKTVTPSTIRNAVLKLRKGKSTLWDTNDPNSISAGCFFTNPTVSQTLFNKLTKKYPEIPNWPLEKNNFRLSAGWMVEKSGFTRGYIYKSTGLSEKHALIIVNPGKATANDIYEFAGLIKEKVKTDFDVDLEIEPVLVGF